MAHKYLSVYLNDHLAGALTAMELLAHLASASAGTEIERHANELHAEVLADRRELESLMAQWKVSQSPPRKTSAWIAEKFSQLKLKLDDHAGGPLRLLEATEAISLGIEGKRSLWLALAAAAEVSPELKMTDYDRLIRRAENQRQRVESMRREAAAKALSTTH